MMAERAVQVLNHRNMGARYVEVFLSSEGEMSRANVSPLPGATWQLAMSVADPAASCGCAACRSTRRPT